MKPSRLLEGDTVGVISPSWGGGAEYPHRVERGVAYLESLGFRVKLAPHAMNSVGYVSDTPENRAPRSTRCSEIRRSRRSSP